MSDSGMLTNSILWGLAATMCMTVILEGSRGLGLSRLSLPFILGTYFTGKRSLATITGFVAYLLGGWLFAAVYEALFLSLGHSEIWLGGIFGFVHGLFLLCVLSIVPLIHPRMASDYARPSAEKRLEPPGLMGLNYGYRTPLTTLIGQTVFGLVLAAGL